MENNRVTFTSNSKSQDVLIPLSTTANVTIKQTCYYKFHNTPFDQSEKRKLNSAVC